MEGTEDVDISSPGPSGQTLIGTGISTSPTQLPDTSQDQRRKRKRSSSPAAGPSQIKKSRRVAPPPKKSKKPNDWHLAKTDIPENADKTKVALEVHIRALWQLPHQNAVPPVVSETDKAIYERRFSSEKEVVSSVHSSLNSNSGNINDARSAVKKLLDSLPAVEGRGMTANHIRRISEGFLLIMFRTVGSFGLVRWAPDILSNDPESMYNLLHEHIALITFEQVAVSFEYSHIGINLSFIRDFALLRKLYRNFVFAYMYKIAKLEAKTPGGLVRANEMGNTWKRRIELARGRANTLKAQGFNGRTVALVEETEANSDDEFAETESHEQVYNIKVKEGRSAKVMAFLRMTDILRRRIAQRKGKYHKLERRRVEPTPPQSSELPTLPRNIPIDWFDPQFWNTLTVRERANYIANGIRIALPLEQHCQSWEQCMEWKNLPEKEFMTRFGNAVLLQYRLPTEAELEQLEEWENEEEEWQEVGSELLGGSEMDDDDA